MTLDSTLGSTSTSQPRMSRLETSNLGMFNQTQKEGERVDHENNMNPGRFLSSSSSNPSNKIKSPISASKTAAFFGESPILQPPKSNSHQRSASSSSNSSAAGGFGGSSASGSGGSGSGSGFKGDKTRSLVSSSSPIGTSSSTENMTNRIGNGNGNGKIQADRSSTLPISESLLSIESLDSRGDHLDRSWESNSRNDTSMSFDNNPNNHKQSVNSISKDQFPNHHQNHIPTSSSNSFSSRWAGGFGSSLQPQPQSSNSLFDGNYHHHNSSSHSVGGNGSVRSRRNWDEFEGKPITPLPSPSLSTNNRFNFGNNSTSNERDEEGENLSAIGFGMNGNHQLPTSTSDSSEMGNNSKTESFFKSSRTPKPPTNRKSSGSSDISNNIEEMNPSRSTSFLENKNNLHQTTRLPTLFTGDSIPGSSSSTSSSALAHSNSISENQYKSRGSASNNGSWLGAGHMRSSSAGSDSDLRDNNFANSPIIANDSNRFGISNATQKESGWGTLSNGYSSVSSSRFRGTRVERGEDENVRGSGSSFSNSSMDFLMAPESKAGNNRRNNGGNPSRHTHGPSENASGSSLIPNFFKEETQDLNLEFNDDRQQIHSKEKSKEGLPTTSDESTSFLFKLNPNRNETNNKNESNQSSNFPENNSKNENGFRLPSSSHAPDERIGGDPISEISKQEKEELLEDENESLGLIGPYKVVSTLGVGAFSKVVLGEKYRAFQNQITTNTTGDKSTRDLEGSDRSLSKLLHSNSNHLEAPEVFVRRPSVTNEEREKEFVALKKQETENQKSLGDRGTQEVRSDDRLVALKIMAREPCKQNERMKVSWVREVEVLKHISHPSLAKFISSFSTPTQHVLVIERIEGGELFDLIDKNQVEIAKREWLVRRLFAEMANAVGWMHSVNLVHRDLKLENVILTTRLFDSSKNLLPTSLPPIPLLKITDFGLSRFIDPNGPLLETRCGSEEYAAPELIIGKRYDGRQTDVWALGVVLYALLSGSIPFLDDNPSSKLIGFDNNTATSRNSREDSMERERDSKQRKSHLLRIAKGDLRWPSRTNDHSTDEPKEEDCLWNNRLITPRARNFCSRLLRRDSSKRITAWESWDDPWLLEGSFLGKEKSLNGLEFDLNVKDPRSAEGRKWNREYTGVRGEKLSGVVLDD